MELLEQVITGCRPFHDILVEAAVMYKVIEGGRPDRPPSGFTDPLWELLVETWREEHGSRSPKRPETSTILNKLRKEADNWGKTIIPPPAGWNGTLFFHDGVSYSGADLKTKWLTAIQRQLLPIQSLSPCIRLEQIQIALRSFPGWGFHGSLTNILTITTARWLRVRGIAVGAG